MSTAASLKRGPKRPQGRRDRLDSFSRPQPRPMPRLPKPAATDCPNPACGKKGTAEEEDAKTICRACGTVIDETNMRSDLSFGMLGSGQHVLQGVHVGANDAHHKQGDMPAVNRGKTSQDMTITDGGRYIGQYGSSLNMTNALKDSAKKIFALASTGFIQGRRIKSVACVACYIACRLQKDNNTFMLVDFADQANIDVFTLGHIYKDLLEYLMIQGNGYVIQPINPEDLILRFCEKLDFKSETMKVARDAVRIVQRMNRDWMTPGRRPAGICGAALILAARMNNFRRTVREMVYIVKVQEQTIFNRLDEFKLTESSGLTVEEFRSIDLERSADPPIFRQQQEGNDGRQKRRRKRMHVDFDDDGDNDQPTVISSREVSTTPANTVGGLSTPANTQEQARIDIQKMPPPPIPVDPSIAEASSPRSQNRDSSSSSPPPNTENDTQSRSQTMASSPEPSSASPSAAQGPPEPQAKRRRGRPSKNLATPPATQKTGVAALPADITAALTDPANLDHANALKSALASMPDSASISTNADNQPSKPRPPVPDSEDISDSEFADDAEVNNCLLSPEEVAMKTRIWTHENREYLRLQAAKLMKEQLAEENGTARTIIHRKRKKDRMGDMTAYLPEGAESGTPVAGSPAEAVMKMLGRRAYSKKIRYEILQDIYGGSPSDSSSRRSSVAGSPGQNAGSPDKANTVAGRNAEVEEDSEVAASEADDQDLNEEQKEVESIAGELEAGINESEVEEEDGDPDDPYEGGGYDDSD